MGSCHTLDQLDSCFADTHAVANAGLLLAATLAERLGIEQAADGAARPGRAGWRAPARPQAADPGPRDGGGWGLRRAPRGAMQPGGLHEPASGLSQQAGEAGGSLTPEAQGRAGATSDNNGTGRHRQTARARQARREGVTGREPVVEPPQANAPAPTWRMWAGQQRTPSPVDRDFVVGVASAGPEATGKVCGVPVARLQGNSWAPPPPTGAW
jgi:hypothetical protein